MRRQPIGDSERESCSQQIGTTSWRFISTCPRVKVCGPNQLWIADMTYVRLKTEFVYLAVVLDAFSRKVVGWSLGRTLQSRLPLNALEKAIANRQPPPGLVHHSDRGVQYACEDYIQVLLDHQMMPSMSRPGNPYDNASCESFMKTLKREEIYANEYRDLDTWWRASRNSSNTITIDAVYIQR